MQSDDVDGIINKDNLVLELYDSNLADDPNLYDVEYLIEVQGCAREGQSYCGDTPLKISYMIDSC